MQIRVCSSEPRGGTPSTPAAGYCVMLTHSLGRPGRGSKCNQQPEDDVRLMWELVLQCLLESQTAVSFKWYSSKVLRNTLDPTRVPPPPPLKKPIRKNMEVSLSSNIGPLNDSGWMVIDQTKHNDAVFFLSIHFRLPNQVHLLPLRTSNKRIVWHFLKIHRSVLLRSARWHNRSHSHFSLSGGRVTAYLAHSSVNKCTYI